MSLWNANEDVDLDAERNAYEDSGCRYICDICGFGTNDEDDLVLDSDEEGNEYGACPECGNCIIEY